MLSKGEIPSVQWHKMQCIIYTKISDAIIYLLVICRQIKKNAKMLCEHMNGCKIVAIDAIDVIRWRGFGIDNPCWSKRGLHEDASL